MKWYIQLRMELIVKEDYDARAGNYIVIQHGNGIESIYCHLSNFLLKTW